MRGNPKILHRVMSIEKIFRKDKYWQKLLKKNIGKRKILTLRKAF